MRGEQLERKQETFHENQSNHLHCLVSTGNDVGEEKEEEEKEKEKEKEKERNNDIAITNKYSLSLSLPLSLSHTLFALDFLEGPREELREEEREEEGE